VGGAGWAGWSRWAGGGGVEEEGGGRGDRLASPWLWSRGEGGEGGRACDSTLDLDDSHLEPTRGVVPTDAPVCGK
jgi:hypothetical protein